MNTLVAMISVDAYPLLASTNLTCHLEDTGIMFSAFTVYPDSTEIELGSRDQEASPSTGKNTRVVIAPCLRWSWWCGYF